MLTWIEQLIDTDGFPKRWYCGKWSDAHGWTHIVSDIAIFGAYVAIPFALAYFVRRRTDVPFPRLFWLFSAFILFCGFSHLIEASIFWRPWYRLSALFKICTAVVSWTTVVAMLPVIPRALRFRSPAELEAEVSSRTKELASVNTLLEGKNQELEQFVYTISHDLKAPLVTTRGFLGALKEDLEPIEDEDVLDSLHRIDRATSRMGDLLNDLLELSRIGRVRNDPDWIDVGVLLSDIEAEIPAEMTSGQHRIRVAERLPKVWADPIRIRQVFDNLIVNACKYAVSEQTPEIRISGEESETSVTFRVSDNGPGIPAEMRSQVFLPFERLTAAGEGSGVGLSIVSRIIAVCGGTIDIEETAGGGATFVITIPKPEPDRAQDE